jgi:hypothetical protein
MERGLLGLVAGGDEAAEQVDEEVDRTAMTPVRADGSSETTL